MRVLSVIKMNLKVYYLKVFDLKIWKNDYILELA